MIHYGVSKTPDIAVARGLAKRMAGTGITVNSVLPGPTLSDGVEAMLAADERAKTGRPIEEVAADFVKAPRKLDHSTCGERRGNRQPCHIPGIAVGIRNDRRVDACGRRADRHTVTRSTDGPLHGLVQMSYSQCAVVVEARPAIQDARNNPANLAQAHCRVDENRTAIRERGPIYRTDGEPDLNRHLVKNRLV